MNERGLKHNHSELVSESVVCQKQSAMHESFELLFADFQFAATARYVQPEEIETAKHTAIGRLVNYMTKHP